MLSRSRTPSSATFAGLSSGTVDIPHHARGTPEPAPAVRSGLGRLFGAGQLAYGGLGVGRPHQGLADQHGVHADLLEVLDLLAAVDAGLRDHDLAGRNVGE